jgi:hypothetical protein
MKKLLLALTIMVGLGILTSCKKATQDAAKQQTITSTIKKDESFQHEFGLIGIEDNMSISQQASHFETSELKRDNTGKIIHTYKPSLNYVGTDEVEVSLDISNGATIANTSKTKIKLTITN